MADNLSFTNNLGTISLSRVMYSISHTYSWDGENPAKPGVEISVTGSLRNSEASLNDVAGANGLPGTLVLPHIVLPKMRIRELTYAEGIWAPWGIVTITFNDTDDSKISDTMIEFKSGDSNVSIYNPTIIFSPSTIKRGEHSIYGMNGWVRQQLGHDIIRISISGEITTEPCTFPADFLSILEQKPAKEPGMSGEEYESISNYPRIADLSAFIPSAKDNYDLKKVMIVDGKLTWHYEDNVADVDIDMIAPPQKMPPKEQTGGT